MPFSEILGHARATHLLNRVLLNGRMAHAYLFSGPAGVGKETVARAMAASLFCENKNSLDPCGVCPGCRQFFSGNHPDFIYIQPDGISIKIDQIRKIKKQLAFSPFAGGMRVVLLDEMHSIRREAGNSLLKILEEPPPDNIFLLIASETEPLLPTILSRCQVVPFAPLSYEQTAQILCDRTPDLSIDSAMSLAKLSGGCPGRALSMDTGNVLPLRDRIVATLLADEESRARAVEEALFLARELAALSADFELIFDLLRSFFKDAQLLSLQKSVGDSSVDVWIKEALRARERWNLSQLSDKMRAIDSAALALGRNCNRGLVCEVLMLQLMTDEPVSL